MNSEKIEQIKKKVKGEGIWINRLPKPTKARFVQVADEEFAGDYGMYIKWLQDFRDGMLSSPNAVIAEQMTVLFQKVEELEGKVQSGSAEKKMIKSVSGKVIKEG